jgi:hypothetical protein
MRLYPQVQRIHKRSTDVDLQRIDKGSTDVDLQRVDKGSTDVTKGSTAGVTGQQRMLTPPWHLILPLVLPEVRVSRIFTVNYSM